MAITNISLAHRKGAAEVKNKVLPMQKKKFTKNNKARKNNSLIVHIITNELIILSHLTTYLKLK